MTNLPANSSEFAAALVAVTGRLASSSWASRLAQVNECSIDELAGETAHGLLDIAESASSLAVELLPKLLAFDGDDDQLEDLLHDIGEELRHIEYHIHDMKGFRAIRIDWSD